MKRFLLLAVMVGATCSTQAQTQAPPMGEVDTAVQIPAPQYSIELPAKPYRLGPYDFDTYRGTYFLSNGDEMTLKQRGRRMYVHLSGRQEQELVAAANNIFVARDRSLKMTLEAEERSDQVTGEVLIRMPRSLADTAAGIHGQVLRLVASH